VTSERLAAAARDGSIEALVDWRPATDGDFYYSPAGTIHALGPGLSLIEVQQSSDVTYRLYDYGRARELHLQAAAEVAIPKPFHLFAQQRCERMAGRSSRPVGHSCLNAGVLRTALSTLLRVGRSGLFQCLAKD
jgi:hypothetical protein